MESGGPAAQAKAVLGHRVTVAPNEFVKIVGRIDRPVIIVSRPGSLGFTPTWQYLTSYKGFLFHTMSKTELTFRDCEIYEAKKIV